MVYSYNKILYSTGKLKIRCTFTDMAHFKTNAECEMVQKDI